LPQIVKAVQTFELSHVPVAHAAVQVVIPVVPTVFFVVDDKAHPPVAKRVVAEDVHVYVGPALELKVASAPSMPVHAVQTLLSSHVPASQVAATALLLDVQVTVVASVTGLHSRHAVLAVLMYEPALQSALHSDCPVRSLYVPSPHRVQAAVPLTYVPTGQVESQLEAPGGLYVSVTHALHSDFLLASW